MSHTDLHAKTEASVAKAQAASQKTYDKINKEGPAKPTTENETQTLRDDPKFCVAYKGSLTRSQIAERLMPDGTTGALRIDGPCIPNAPGAGGFLTFLSDGAIILRTGRKTEQTGSGASILSVYTEGQVQFHEGRSNLVYCEGGPESQGQALNVKCLGDYVERTVGATRYIRAQKVVIEASEELMLIGKSQVNIQAGGNGGGTITLSAGTIEKVTDNLKEVITGQKMTFGASEDQKMVFDPRANVVINSPGHLNTNVLGTYNAKVGGLVDWKVGGAYNMDIGGLYSNKVAGAATISAGGTFIAAATGNSSITSAGNVTLASVGTITQQSGGDISITSAIGGVNIDAKTDVKIKGALIYLN